jgi:hypothetical protein
VAIGGRWRADDDEGCRGIQRSQGLILQSVTGGEVVPIAKNWAKGFRDSAKLRLATDKVVVDAKPLKPSMYYLGPSTIAVAVRDECSILYCKGKGSGHSARSVTIDEWTCGPRAGEELRWHLDGDD